MSKMPAQKPGRSEQTVETPPEFIAAVEARFGQLDIDFAADYGNTKAPRFLNLETDALTQNWDEAVGCRCWLNPPYAKLMPWIEKSLATVETEHLMLLPSATGAKWFRKLHDEAMIYFLAPRLTFVGHTSPYPKDLILAHRNAPNGIVGYEHWIWR